MIAVLAVGKLGLSLLFAPTSNEQAGSARTEKVIYNIQDAALVRPFNPVKSAQWTV
jgi:hypothetical protein